MGNSSAKPLSDWVQLRAGTLRSVNIVQDITRDGMVDSYILSGQSLASLGRIISGFQSLSSNRAWTLTGPYGSGKSSFGLYLSHLACTDMSGHAQTIKQLREIDPVLAEEATKAFFPSDKHGLIPIPISGYRADFLTTLTDSFRQAIESFSSIKENTELLQRLDAITPTKNAHQFFDWLDTFRDYLAHTEHLGVLLIFDELGKSLEFLALHPEESDVHLLQELAEYANRSDECPVVFIGILHQAFERYAEGLDSLTQHEWAKVQGRFEDIAFQESPHQQMRLMAQAFTNSPTDDSLRSLIKDEFQKSLTSGWFPPAIKTKDIQTLTEQVYPLHPTAFVALPYIFRRLAQNERSIFAYLISGEPAGFQDFLHNHKVGEFLRLADIFDYLQLNFQWHLASSGKNHVLVEAIERLDSSPDLSQYEQDVIKSIALLNWMGSFTSFKATPELLKTAVNGHSGALPKTLLSLQKRSLVIYRKFNQSYAIWQGSDVDIEVRLNAGRQFLGKNFSPAQALQKYLPSRPLIAHRHSYQTGTLRLFQLQYVDFVTYEKMDLNIFPETGGQIILCLPLNHTEIAEFISWAQEGIPRSHNRILVGIPLQVIRLNQLLLELRSLHWVRENTPALAGDPVARREWRARLSNIENLIREQIERTLSFHRLSQAEQVKWFYQGEDIREIANGGSLSAFLSWMSDQLYPDTPRIWNELLNRHALTSQGSAARRRLIEAIWTQAETPRLGIEGYPPERSMYESVLFAGGIHSKDSDEVWGIIPPLADDPLHLTPTWRALFEFVFQAPPEPRPLNDLYQKLLSPPLGLTHGVIPVLLCAFVAVHRDEITFYREGTLLVEIDVPDWEILLRRPELFSVAGYQVTPERKAILDRFGRGLQVKPATLPIVRKLVVQLNSLPDHAWRTNRLPDHAIALRKAIRNAHSPEQLLFLELPEAVGIAPFMENAPSSKHIEEFFIHLNLALEILANVTPKLRIRVRNHFLKSCEFQASSDGWMQFLDEAKEMSGRVTQPKLFPLLKRAADATNPDLALESVLAYIANRPLRRWTDADVDRFFSQSEYFGKLFNAERTTHSSEILPNAEIQAFSQEIASQLRNPLLEHYATFPEATIFALRLLLKELETSLVSS